MRRVISALLSDGHGGLDEQALISIAGALVFFSMEIYSVVMRGHAFDPLAFGTGFGTLLGATSAGFGLRTHLSTTAMLNVPANIDPVTGRFIGDPNAANPS